MINAYCSTVVVRTHGKLAASLLKFQKKEKYGSHRAYDGKVVLESRQIVRRLLSQYHARGRVGLKL